MIRIQREEEGSGEIDTRNEGGRTSTIYFAFYVDRTQLVAPTP